METTREPGVVRAELRAFVKRQFGAAAGRQELADDQPLLAQGIVDSLGVLELVNFLEKHFQITVGDNDLVPDNFQTINALTSLVCSKQGGFPGDGQGT